MKPLCIDLFFGCGGWAAGFVAEGYRVIGFDIVHEDYHGPVPDGCELVLQDVLTVHGSQFKDAAVIVASPPCQAYSYRAMPWKRAKALPPPDNSLFEACFRIQREASEAAGRYIPLVVENVKGAQPYVGRAKWHFGSYYLWGDVPAIMPRARSLKNSGGSWFGQRDGVTLERNDPRDVRRNANGDYENAATRGGWNHPGKALDGSKNADGSWFAVAQNTGSGHSRNPVAEGTKFDGDWFHDTSNNLIRKASSRSTARKAASAAIARIPFPLAQWIAKVYRPEET